MNSTIQLEVISAKDGSTVRTVTLDLRNEIGFYRCHRSRNYIVTWINKRIPSVYPQRRQQLVMLPRAFVRICPQIAEVGFAGVVKVSEEQLRELGFIVPVDRRLTV